MQIYRTYFGKKLAAARSAARITQAELAEKARVKPSTVSKWENGKDFPGKKKLELINKALELSSDYFDVNAQEKTAEFKDAADFLATYANLPPKLRRIVYALVYQDPSLYAEHPILKRALE